MGLLILPTRPLSGGPDRPRTSSGPVPSSVTGTVERKRDNEGAAPARWLRRWRGDSVRAVRALVFMYWRPTGLVTGCDPNSAFGRPGRPREGKDLWRLHSKSEAELRLEAGIETPSAILTRPPGGVRTEGARPQLPCGPPLLPRALWEAWLGRPGSSQLSGCPAVRSSPRPCPASVYLWNGDKNRTPPKVVVRTQG